MKDDRPLRFLCHGRPTLRLAVHYGWLPGARYTNLRDVRGFERIGLIDVDWRSYSFRAHLAAVKATRPVVTVARDVQDIRMLRATLEQASELALWAQYVVIVPKDPRLTPILREAIPRRFLLGYSVPTSYGTTAIPPCAFGKRRVHLLGGRPDAQYKLAKLLNVFSFDGNRFTLDASFGDYFTGEGFKRHPKGGYYRCIRESLKAINALWRKQ